MNQKKNTTLTVELSTADLRDGRWYYATLDLPAKGYEITDALQKARAIDITDNGLALTILSCPQARQLEDVRLDAPTIKELNFFAQRLASLPEEEQYVLAAVLPRILPRDITELVPMKDLINCTYDLDGVVVVSCVETDKDLGQFVIENELWRELDNLPEDVADLLDWAAIGRSQRAMDEGVFIGSRYVAAGEYVMPEFYDGQTLPESEPSPWFAFRLLLTGGNFSDPQIAKKRAVWVSLPTAEGDMEAIANALGERYIADCICLDFESSIPQISSDIFCDMSELKSLDAFSSLLGRLSPMENMKFKAVLEAEHPKSIGQFLDVIRNLPKYELEYSASDAGEFYQDYLRAHLDNQIDTRWLDTLLVRNEGEQLLQRMGATVTPYGVISARGTCLYDYVPRDVPEQACREKNAEKPGEDMDKDEHFCMGGMRL